MLSQFTDFFIENKIPAKARFLVGVSGGIDSVVLAHLCKKNGFEFAIGHCNFHLREEESNRDEKFVRELAKLYQVELFVENFDTTTFAAENKLSVQEAARDLRYQFFARICSENGFDYTMLAHHADDNIETLLMNFCRGTGIKGLKGIPAVSKKQVIFLRPLLGARRAEIVECARINELVWAEDSSNESIKYTRNYFRHEVIPAISKVYPSVEANIIDNAERFRKIDNFYSRAIEQTKKDITVYLDGEARIAVKKLLPFASTSLIYEIISSYGFGEKQVPDFLNLLNGQSGRFIENAKYQLIRHDKWIIFSLRSPEASVVTIGENESAIEFAYGSLVMEKLEKTDFRMDPSPHIAFADARHIEFPLVLRKWKQGDYFYPLGMPKKKKLARFLIDTKLSKNKKDDVWVLESNKRIVWVVGMRIDHRFRIQESTMQLFKFTFKRKNFSH